MKTLVIYNRKGGVSKSTCSAHIGLEAAKNGLKVIYIDMDPQKSLENWWNLREQENPHLTDSSALELPQIIHKLQTTKLDLCIIDTPGDVSDNAVSSIKVADLVLIPTKPTGTDLKAIARTILMVEEAKKEYFFFVSQAIAQSKTTMDTINVLSGFGPVNPIAMTNRVSYINAMSTGISAGEFDKTAKIEIEALWTYVAEKLALKKLTSKKYEV